MSVGGVMTGGGAVSGMTGWVTTGGEVIGGGTVEGGGGEVIVVIRGALRGACVDEGLDFDIEIAAAAPPTTRTAATAPSARRVRIKMSTVTAPW